MGASYWLLLLVGGSCLLSIIRCNVCPRDGRQGVNGAPGRHGIPGPKGEKGQPALVSPSDPLSVLRLKGDTGPRGAQGPPGPKGYSGHLGDTGQAGQTGERGPDGVQLGKGAAVVSPQKHSVFSVIRSSVSYPRFSQVVTFDQAVVNDPADFNLGTGYFTCRSDGVYYFTFTSTAKVSMCLSICSDALTEDVTFCDFNRNFDQVLTGGVVLQLRARQSVWLKSIRDIQPASDQDDRKPKKIHFSGFLIF